MDDGKQDSSSGAQITLGGHTLRTVAITAAHYAEIEAAVRATLPNPFVVVRDSLPIFKEDPAGQRMLVDSAMRHSLSGRPYIGINEVTAWLRTLAGAKFSLWMSVRDNGPQYTLDYVSGLLDAQLTAALSKADRQPAGPVKDSTAAPTAAAA